MTIPHMTETYVARVPAHYAAQFAAKAEEARRVAESDSPLRELARRQVRFWQRLAEG